MVTTACQMNCHYCPFRAGRSKMQRLTFTPDELASGLDTLQQAPLEIVTASRDQLLRLPGIGPVSADAILKARRQGKLSALTDLQKLGIRAPQQASPYILLSGRRPAEQLSLF